MKTRQEIIQAMDSMIASAPKGLNTIEYQFVMPFENVIALGSHTYKGYWIFIFDDLPEGVMYLTHTNEIARLKRIAAKHH